MRRTIKLILVFCFVAAVCLATVNNDGITRPEFAPLPRAGEDVAGFHWLRGGR